MCSVQVPVAVLEYFDRARRYGMWNKSQSNARNRPLVAWKKCTRPKKKGGLGIINLRTQNKALLLKHLDKCYNKRDIPWVNLIWNTYHGNGEIPHATKDKESFWWKDIIRLSDDYRAVAKCKIGDGSTLLFWSDVWNDLLLEKKIPRLYSYAKNKNISVAMFILNNRIEDQFHLPLSVQAFQEYQQLQQVLQNLQVDNSSRDSWEYIWGNSKYTAARFYHHTFKHFHPPNLFIWLWDSKCSNKIRVFAWLLMMDRLNVRNIL
jgi:hypothetical protein